MKKSGLKNRFPESVRNEWTFWYDCMYCGKNQWNCLHHIISPSSRHYKAGDHNKSVLNSCPLHNFGCHIDNEVWLGKNVELLLSKTFVALVSMGYVLNDVDVEFVKIYKKLYEEN